MACVAAEQAGLVERQGSPVRCGTEVVLKTHTGTRCLLHRMSLSLRANPAARFLD